MRHHEETLERYVASVAEQPAVLGVVLVGSVARGTARRDSDVDVYLVVTDETYAAAADDDAIAFMSTDGVTYPGGYVDVKLASPGYLTAAAERADDPTRASFAGARVSLDKTGEIPAWIDALGTLPASSWDRRVAGYRAQAELYGGYFLVQADQRGDPFLRQHSAVHLALAAGRLALAKRRRFFRGQKYLSTMLTELELPDDFTAGWHRLVRTAEAAAGAQLLAAIANWIGPSAGIDAELSRFVADNELGWLNGTTPPEFW